jgi:hypothetical protein
MEWGRGKRGDEDHDEPGEGGWAGGCKTSLESLSFLTTIILVSSQRIEVMFAKGQRQQFIPFWVQMTLQSFERTDIFDNAKTRLREQS